MGGCSSDPKKITMKLYVIWVLPDADGDHMHAVSFADGVLEQREARRAFDGAPHVPTAGALTVSTFYEKLQVDLFSWVISLRCAPRALLPKIPSRCPVDRRIPRRHGMHFAMRGSGFFV